MPLTLKSRSLEPVEDFPSGGGFLGGTWGPGSPRIFEVGGPGGISLKKYNQVILMKIFAQKYLNASFFKNIEIGWSRYTTFYKLTFCHSGRGGGDGVESRNRGKI